MQMSNKSAISAAWSFFKGNIALSLGAIALLIGLGILQYAPLIGVIFSFAYPVLSFAVQIYVGREAATLSAPEEMERVAADTKLSDLFGKYIDLAMGGFMGLFILMIFFFVLLAIMMGAVVDHDKLQAIAASGEAVGMVQMQSIMLEGRVLEWVVIPLFIVLLFLSYIFPAVMGRVILSENFTQAFKSVFGFFSPRLWSASFNSAYFTLVFFWSIIVFLSAIVAGQFFVTIFLIPVALVILYCISIYNAIVYSFAAKLSS